jgi:hypothetical protein
METLRLTTEGRYVARPDLSVSASDCGFNRSTQRIDEIVQLVSRNSVFFSGVR